MLHWLKSRGTLGRHLALGWQAELPHLARERAAGVSGTAGVGGEPRHLDSRGNDFGHAEEGEYGEEPAGSTVAATFDGVGSLNGTAAAQGARSEGLARLTQWKESTEFAKFIGITTFFNPGRHQNKVDNFRAFSRSVAEQGLRMLCVELVFGEARSQLGADACDISILRRTPPGNTLWQKERLLNIALENLPDSVEKVMWLDSDLIFLNQHWVLDTSALLDKFPVVQPFGWMTYLPAIAGGTAEAGNAYAAEKLSSLPLGMGVGGIYHSAGLGMHAFPELAFRSTFLLGHPGFAWAARREVITASGFYDRSIIGGGDRIMLNAFSGHYAGISRKMPPAMAADVRRFGSTLQPLVGVGNVSYTPGVVLHVWHGNMANRDYRRRYHILQSNRYDPRSDVRVNKDGVLEWATSKERLHREVSDYFKQRKEGAKYSPANDGGSSSSRPPAASADGAVGGGPADDEEKQETTMASRKHSLSRAVQSFLGYHCGRPDYREACKIAFRLWSTAMEETEQQVAQWRASRAPADAATLQPAQRDFKSSHGRQGSSRRRGRRRRRRRRND